LSYSVDEISKQVTEPERVNREANVLEKTSEPVTAIENITGVI